MILIYKIHIFLKCRFNIFKFYLIIFKSYNYLNIIRIVINFYGDWGLGIGDWGLGIGDWAQSPIPNPQSPIPNPQFIFNIILIKLIKKKH